MESKRCSCCCCSEEILDSLDSLDKCLKCFNLGCQKFRVYNCWVCSEDAKTEARFLCRNCVVQGDLKANIFQAEKKEGICVCHYIDVRCSDCNRCFKDVCTLVQACTECNSELFSSCCEKACNMCKEEEERKLKTLDANVRHVGAASAKCKLSLL